MGAATWSTYYLSRSLLQRGHYINLIVPNVQYALSVKDRTAKILEKKLPVALHRTPILKIPKNLAPFLSPFFLFFKGLRVGRDSDIIFCQFHPHHFVFVTALLIGKIFGIPVVARANDVYRKMDKGFRYKWLIKIINVFNEYFIKYAEAFLVICSENKDILLSRLGKNASNCHISLSYNGVNQSMFNEYSNQEEAKKILNITQEKVILFIGRYSGSEYGIDVLLEALPFILLKHPKTLLILVGDEMISHQKELVNSLGISKNIRVYGSRPHKEIVKFIVAADICIGPLTPTLAIPQKILEYMACGKPVVTGIKSVSRDLNPNVNFLVVSPEPIFVAESIIKILENEEYSKILSSNGKTIAKRFTWEKIGAELERLLLKTLEAKI